MPLDDIFYKEEKPILVGAKQLEKRWRIACYITGVLAWISVSILSLLDTGIGLETLIFSIFLIFQLPIMTMVISSMLSKLFGFIPYNDFSKEERIDIYYYIIINLIYLILILAILYAIFFDGVLDNYLDKLEQ